MAIGSMYHRVWNVRQAVDEHEVIMTHWNLDIESISWLILVSMSTSLIVQVFFGHWVRMFAYAGPSCCVTLLALLLIGAGLAEYYTGMGVISETGKGTGDNGNGVKRTRSVKPHGTNMGVWWSSFIIFLSLFFFELCSMRALLFC
jgi:hypothetical protein